MNYTENFSLQNFAYFLHPIYDSYFTKFILDYLKELVDHLIIIVLVYSILCLLLYKIAFTRYGHLVVKNKRFPDNPKRILLTIAHPDDECMFFGPSLLALKREENCRVFVLCLSNGYNKKIGNVRRHELFKACEALSIPSSDVTIMNLTYLQDDPKVDWKVEIIAPIIVKFIETLDIDILLTFDKDGISQHPNHCAIFYAAASLCLSRLLPKNCRVLTLETVNVFRKYISLFDLPLSILLSTNWSIISWSDRRKIQTAMHQHKSQMVWFRKLYIIFSRYMLINSLREINQDDIEFEILET